MKRKMFAALALSATLAMGAVPAFAATDGSTDTPTSVDKSTGVGNTTVSVKTETTNIQATIPLNMTVVGPAEGGNLTGVPSDYKIINGSVYPIKVIKVKADMTDITDWALATGNLTTTSTTSGKVGDLSLFIQPADGAKWNVSETESAPVDWIVDAKTGEGTEKIIEVSGSVSPIKSVSDTATPAVKIQYTVAATTATPAA